MCFRGITSKVILVFLTLVLAAHAFSADLKVLPPAIEIAITFDDLPFHEAIRVNKKISSQESLVVTKKVTRVLKKHHMPATWGFVNAKAVQFHPDMIKSLQYWVDSGNKLGNHTYSHSDLGKMSANQFVQDIKKNETLLQRITSKKERERVFRYPFLSYGDIKDKYDRVRNYLTKNNYKTAYVTMDFFDSEWSPAYRRCLQDNNISALQWLEDSYLQHALNAITIGRSLSQQLLHRDIKYILLLHFSDIQAEILDQLLTQYKQKGVKFISLELALTDPVYQIDPEVYRKRAYTLLNRIRLSRAQANPKIVSLLYATLPEEELAAICQ